MRISNRTARAVTAAVVAVAAWAGVLSAGTVPANASVAGTQHVLPAFGASGVSFLCGPDIAYSCTPGYTGTNVPASAWAAYGCPNASGCPSTPHNCTLYAMYRLNLVGVVPNWSADASAWAANASADGVKVDQTATAGAIAQWNAFKGHVAYVESVSASSVTLTMDWWSSATATPYWPDGYTSRVRIAVDSPAWPDNFLHFKDVPPPAADSGGYTLDGFGGVHPFAIGAHAVPPTVRGAGYWLGWDIAVGLALTRNGAGGYTLDGFGGLHPFSVGSGTRPRPVRDNPYWLGWDAARGVALMPNGAGGYEVDLYGGIHRFRLGSGALPPAVHGNPYWLGADRARGITILPDGSGGYVVDAKGRLFPFSIGSGAMPTTPTGVWRAPTSLPAQGVALVDASHGGYTVDGTGGIHGFTLGARPPAPSGNARWPGWSIARDLAVLAGS